MIFIILIIMWKRVKMVINCKSLRFDSYYLHILHHEITFKMQCIIKTIDGIAVEKIVVNF